MLQEASMYTFAGSVEGYELFHEKFAALGCIVLHWRVAFVRSMGASIFFVHM